MQRELTEDLWARLRASIADCAERGAEFPDVMEALAGVASETIRVWPKSPGVTGSEVAALFVERFAKYARRDLR